MNIKALVILAEGHEEIEAITPIDLLRRVGINVTVAGLTSKEVKGSHGLITVADTTLDEYSDDFDALILPGGMPGTTNLENSNKVIELVKKAEANSSKVCAAICAAPRVLYKAGILKGKNFTCYPGVEDEILDGKHSAENVVIDGNVITSRGVGTAIDFSLAIVEYLVDTYAADILSSKIIYHLEEQI